VSKLTSSSNRSSNLPASSSRKWMRGVGVAASIVIVAVVALAWSPSRQRAVAADSSSSVASHSVVSSSVAPSSVSQAKAGSLPAQAKLRAGLAALPLAFEQNQGQVDPRAKYMARGNGYKLFLTASDAVLTLKSPTPGRVSRPRQIMEQRLLGYSRQTHKSVLVRSIPVSSNPSSSSMAAISMRMVNGNADAKVEGRGRIAGKVNYFIGNVPKNWHANVPEFESVSYSGIYPGIDLVYHGQQKQLEFDFVVAPQAKPESIALNFAGVRHMTTDKSGDLVLTSASGDLTLRRPVAYQQGADGRKVVDARFVIAAKHQIGFVLGNYDHTRELVIDPVLSYATYIGGNGDDEAYGVGADSSGNFYITGESDSTSGFPGSPTNAGGYDSFVVKILANGSLGYTTFVGGTGDDLGSGIAVNASTGMVYVAGITTSTDFPVTAGVVQPTSGSPAGSDCNTATSTNTACTDGFVFELNSSGAKLYATYLGGNNDDGAFGIAIDAAGDAYVTGFTYSANFLGPVTGLYNTLNDGGASSPPYEDAFVSAINPTGTQFIYSTFLGGANNDFGTGITVDSTGNAYVAGGTSSVDFPMTPGAYQTKCGTDGNCNAGNGSIFSDVFVTEIAAGGASVNYSTYLGGSSDDYALALSLDGSGNIYVTGQTSDDNPSVTTGDFPVVGGFETQYGNGNGGAGFNAFVSEITPAGKGAADLVYSSYLGGSTADTGLGIVADTAGNAYVTGSTLSSDFPLYGAFQSTLNGNSDAFLAAVAAGGANLAYSSFLGGSGDENYDSSASGFLGGGVAYNSSDNLYVAGTTSSSDFPTTGSPLEATYGGAPFDAFAAVSPPGYVITASTPSAVSPGSSATSTITLTSPNFPNNVALTCSVTGSGSPLPACGSFSSSSVTPTPGGATSTLTITTTGSSSAMILPSKFVYAAWLPIFGFSLVGISFASGRSRQRKILGFMMIAMVMASLFLMPACGGGSSNGGGSGGGGCSGCTPAGSYAVTVTGTGADSAKTTQTATFSLSVN
jgi:hypothetical protein